MSFFYANNGKLLNATKTHPPGAYPPIKIGDTLCIRLMGAGLCGMSNGPFDSKNKKYPILVYSKVVISGRSEVEQVHYYHPGKQNGSFLNLADECFNDIIYLQKSWAGEEVSLILGIYEVDKISEDWVKAIEQFASIAGAVFLPYAAHIWGAGALAKLAIAANNKFNKNDKVVERKITLVPENTLHRNKLMPGRYVAIEIKPNSPSIDPKSWELSPGPDNKLIPVGVQSPVEYPYIVFEVSTIIPDGMEKVQVSQNLAHFLKMIQGDKKDQKPSDYADLMKSAAEGFAMYRNLKTIRSLYDKGSSRSDVEMEKLKALLENIEIKNFEYVVNLKKELLEA
jgi:hypothetical protein